MGLSFARAMLKQKISLADINPAAREAALQNGAAIAYDHVEPEAAKRILKEIEAALMRSSTLPARTVSILARGGKIVVCGLMGAISARQR